MVEGTIIKESEAIRQEAVVAWLGVVTKFSLPNPQKYQNPPVNRAGNPRTTALQL